MESQIQDKENIAGMQEEICQIIQHIGGYIKWQKAYDPAARAAYKLLGKEPRLHVEALFLGEKFGVIIEPDPTKVWKSDFHRIFTVRNVADFHTQFNAFKEEKLRS